MICRQIKTLIFFLLINPLTLPGQDTLSHNTEVTLFYTRGFLIAHRPLVVPLQQDKFNSLEFNISWQTNGSKDWHHNFNFPKAGISFSAVDLGNEKQLGHSYSLIPYIDFPLSKNEVGNFYIKFGWGLGYVEKPFDSDDNYKNVAIGSRINFALILQPHYKFRINDRLTVNAGLTLGHYSNGSVATPNLGLNLLGATAGLTFNTGNPVMLPEKRLTEIRKSRSITVFAAGFFKQVYPAEGKNYFAGSVYGDHSWRVRRKTSLSIGADLFFDDSLYPRIEEVTGEEAKTLEGFRAGIHAGYELMVSRVSLVINMGGYLYSQYEDGSFYHRIGLKYAFNEKLYSCVNIKAHWGKADYIELGAGYRIFKKYK